MAKTLEVKHVLSFDIDYEDSADLNSKRGSFVLSLNDALADGTGADEADVIWYDSRTVTGASETLDLCESLTDVFGDSVDFSSVKGIYIRNKATTSGYDLKVGKAGGSAFDDFVGGSDAALTIGPGGHATLWSPVDGYTAAGGTQDELKIDPGANTISYDIALLGVSS